MYILLAIIGVHIIKKICEMFGMKVSIKIEIVFLVIEYFLVLLNYKNGLIILKDKYEIISEIYIIVLLLYMYVFRLHEGKYEKAIRLVRAFLIFILLFYSDLRLWG
ncbi:MAG: hypothetical protein PHD56_14505 [Anaerostipes sp.]|nr:hypothetical protein [Anaerostipes sp.]